MTMLSRVLGNIVVGFLLGIFIHSLFPHHVIGSSLLFMGIGISAMFLWFSHHPRLFTVGILLLGGVLGLLRFDQTVPRQTLVDMIFVHENQQVTLIGNIIDDPDHGLSNTQFVLKTEEIFFDNRVINESQKILVSTDVYSRYQYGDRVEVTGNLSKPEPFETETGRVFRYDNFLAKDGIYSVVRNADVTIIDSGQGSAFRSRLYRTKAYILDTIHRLIPRPESGLLAGILLGEKSALDDETEDQFRIVGLMHIVVLSGYNVSIVIYAIMFLLRWVPLSIRSALAVFGIVSFAIITGAGPTVMRASIMALIIVMAGLFGRRYDVTRGLVLAGFVMVLINPWILYFDISFQLSVLATYGLITLSPWLEDKLSWLPSWFMIRQSAVATIAAQILVMPLLLYAIGEFSVVSILVNVLVLFSVPAAMLFGFVMVLAVPISDILAQWLATITGWLLRYQLWIVDLFAQFSYATIQFPAFHWIFMVTIYAVIFRWLYRLNKHQLSKLSTI